MKTFTIILGFVTGIIFSMFIGDAIDFAGRKVISFRAAMHIRKAEQLAAAKRFPEAVALYDQVLENFPESAWSRLFARVKTSQGLTLSALAARTNNADDIIRAIRAFEGSLAVYRIDHFPENYAAAQNNIGILYLRLAEMLGRGEYFRSAVSAFDESLRVFTADKYPQNRAMVEANRAKAAAATK